VVSATEMAAAAVDDARATVGRWEADEAAKLAELADLERRAGDEVLADESAAVRLAGELAALRAGADIARRAGVAAGRRLVVAERALTVAQAADLREQADTLRRGAAKRQAVTDGLLEQLREQEGCAYAPFTSPDAELRARMGEPVEYGRPLTGQMVGQAEVLEARAAALLTQLPVDVPAGV